MTKDLTDGAGVEAKIQSAQVAPIESKEGDGQPPFGRPTKYDPIYCDMVEEEMAKGFSLTAFAGIIGVARSIINEWMAENPEFSDAVNRAKAKCLLQWKRKSLKVADNGGSGGQSAIIIFGLKNMGGDA